eukprot:COSAG01_NODE_2147_length_8301_cov_6.653621_8_plen_72_part_00
MYVLGAACFCLLARVRGGGLTQAAAAEGALAAAQAGPLLPSQTRDAPDTRPLCFDFQKVRGVIGAIGRFGG